MPRKSDNARALVQKIHGPGNTTYTCPFCAHYLSFRHIKGGMLEGYVGRGYGLKMGGTLHSQMGAHIRLLHRDRLTIRS